MKRIYFLNFLWLSFCFTSYGMENNHEDIAKQLIKDPNAVLQEIKKVRKPINKIFDVLKSSLVKTPLISEWYAEFDRALNAQNIPDHPLLFLNECEGKEQDGSICLLARKIKPHYRAAFEDKVVEALNSIKAQPIEYADFGSGACFQTLVSLTKFLNTNKTAALNAHLIDLAYYDASPEGSKAIVNNWEHMAITRKERTIKEALFNKKALANLSLFIQIA